MVEPTQRGRRNRTWRSRWARAIERRPVDWRSGDFQKCPEPSTLARRREFGQSLLGRYAAMYFVGGYFLYSSMFAAIGAASSNDQDAQQLQRLAMAPLVFCMLICNVILNDPTSKISVVLSEFPLFSPVLMALRISLKTPPGWQIVVSVVLLFLATVGPSTPPQKTIAWES